MDGVLQLTMTSWIISQQALKRDHTWGVAMTVTQGAHAANGSRRNGGEEWCPLSVHQCVCYSPVSIDCCWAASSHAGILNKYCSNVSCLVSRRVQVGRVRSDEFDVESHLSKQGCDQLPRM
jgi:hypothetical protein